MVAALSPPRPRACRSNWDWAANNEGWRDHSLLETQDSFDKTRDTRGRFRMAQIGFHEPTKQDQWLNVLV